eukprot:840116_1
MYRMKLTTTMELGNFLFTFMLLLRLTHSACWLDLAIQSGNVSFSEALNGVKLDIAMYDSSLPWIDYDSKSKTFIGGYSVDIVNTLANKAGFVPNITLLELQGDETYTEAAQRAIQSNDFLGPWFTDSSSRRLLNLTFAHHFVDATSVLIIPLPKYEEKTFSSTAFLKPFTPGLWI